MKKVAILINSLAVAGAEKIVALLINSFKSEMEIHLILLNDTIELDIDKSAIKIKIIDQSKLYGKNNRIWDIIKIPLLARKLKTYLKQNNISVCVSFLNRSNFINAFTKRIGWKGKVILCERIHTSSHYTPDSLGGKLGRFLVKKLYKKADLIITNAKAMAFDLHTNFSINTNITTIYNPINLEQNHIKANETIEDVNFDKFTFILVGRFHEQKNHKLLLEAVKLIEDLDFQVLLIGKGSLEPIIEAYAKQLAITHQLKFMGFKANPIKYMAKSNCTVMTSNYEGFPNVLLESLACGTPVISTDCFSGPKELLGGNYESPPTTEIEYLKYGIIVPLKNKETLAAAMRNAVLNQTVLADYKAIIKKRAEEFSIDKTVDQFKSAIESIL